MTTVTLQTAEAELATLIKRARSGEEIVISDGEGPAVKLSPLPSPGYRGRGALKGKIAVSETDLFEPLPEEEIARFWADTPRK